MTKLALLLLTITGLALLCTWVVLPWLMLPRLRQMQKSLETLEKLELSRYRRENAEIPPPQP